MEVQQFVTVFKVVTLGGLLFISVTSMAALGWQVYLFLAEIRSRF